MNRTFILILLLCLASMRAYSCSCITEKRLESKEDLKKYDFIAQVKITSINEASDENIEYYIYSLSFETLEIYRGESIKNILVSGSNKIFDRWTSCDLNLDIGDEWIIFGYKEKKTKKLITGYCTRSTKTKSFDGYENIKDPEKNSLTKKLNQLFDKKENVRNKNGKRLEYYKNGNLQLEENYKELVLNGSRKIWYPNGQLESNQYYKGGQKNGIFKWYSKNGELIKAEKFVKSKHVDTTFVWREIDTTDRRVRNYSKLKKITEEEGKSILSKRSLQSISIYNSSGECIKGEKYFINGTLREKNTFDTIKKHSTQRRFHLNGNLASLLIKDKSRNRIFSRKWDKNGDPVVVRGYDAEGNRVKY